MKGEFMKKYIQVLSTAALAATLLGACATNRAVDERIATSQAQTNQRIESVASQVETLQQRQQRTEQRVEELSQSAQEALRRAEEAGVLARGRVVFEQAFSEDRVKFGLGSHRLTTQSRAALDEFATRVKAIDRPVFIEIQGHTDDTGSDRLNEDLGQRRAEEVRRYLSREHKLPLARMSTVSYGESLPLESNRTRAGRMANRRVVLVVLE
jgi:peptidoglycan-associated lipoprotein